MDWKGVKTPKSESKHTTKTVLKRRVIGTPKSADSSNSSFYIYEEDWWEMPGAAVSDSNKPLPPTMPSDMLQTKEPKTDYTYSRSASYTRNHTDEGYVSPNMSRRRLREDMNSMSVSMSTGSSARSPMTKHTLPQLRVDQTYLLHNAQDSSKEHHTVRREGSPGKATYNYYAELSDQEFEEPSKRLLGVHGLRIPRSATRSGCKYGRNWAPGSKEEQRARRRSKRRSQGGTELENDVNGDSESEYSVELNDIEAYRKVQKQIDYAGEASLMKERSLKYIYGLDHSEGEFSDTEVTEQQFERRPPHTTLRKASIFTTLYTFISTIITTIITTAHSFVQERSANVVTGTALVGTYVKIAASSAVHTISRAVAYAFYVLYSLLIALFQYLWQAVRWICYDIWVGGAKYVTQLVSGGTTTAASGSSSDTEHEITTTTTTVTTTVTETVTEEDEYGIDEVDEGAERMNRAVRTSSHAELHRDSWLTRTLKTVMVTTTYILLLPVTAVKGAVSGVASTRKWLVSAGEDLESVPDASLESRSVLENTGSHQESSGAGTRRRRSKPKARFIRESSAAHSVVVLPSEESIVTRFRKRTASILRTILWLPVGVCIGIGHMVTRPVYYVAGLVGLAHSEDAPFMAQSMGRVYDEDKDTDTTAEYKNDTISAETYTTSATHKSWLLVIMETVSRAAWWPIAALLGFGRMVTRPVYYVAGLVGLAHSQNAPFMAQSMGLFSPRRVYNEDKDADASLAYQSDTMSTETYTTSATHKSWLLVIVETVSRAAWWPIAALLACCQWIWCGTCAVCRWFVGHTLPATLLGSANKLHRGLAKSAITDTWLLTRTGYVRRAYGCCCWLIPILLIPLLLTCAYYAYNRGLSRSLVIPVVIPTSKHSDTKETTQAGAGAVYTDAQLAAHVQTILIGLLREREKETHTILHQDWRTWADEFAAGQSAALTSHRAEVDAVVAGLVKEQVGILAAGVSSQSEQDAAKQAAALAIQQDKIAALQQQISTIISQSDGLRDQLVKARADMSSEDAAVRASGVEAVRRLEEKLDQQATDLRHLQASHGTLAAAFKDCCKNESALALMIRKGVEEHVAAMLGGGGSGTLPMGGPGAASSHPTFLTWLHNQFVGRDDMDSRLAALLAKIEDDIKVTSSEAQNAAALAAAAAAAASKKSEESEKTKEPAIFPGAATGGVTEKHVQMLIQQALMLYSADKTGKVDYALESAGGSVVSTRCSETYHRRTAQLSLFGIPLWYTSNSPRTVIQPDMQPGQCWAFRGHQGYLVIQMANLIRPTAFTMEHIPKTLSPTGKIDSAPKDFSVLGLRHDRDRDGTFLGNFTYIDDGEPLQTFLVTEPIVQSFAIIELQINSNHGNKEYTCLYRFRVHGVLDL